MTARRDFDPDRLGPAAYALLNSVVVPRPIAWVTSRSADGVDNLAPHSYFTVASTQPPVVQFTSIGHKDTLRNVQATGEFVVSICTHALADVVNVTGTDFPSGTSEYDVAGLTREPSTVVGVPRVAESPVAIECRLAGTHSFGQSTVVFGEVRNIAVAESVLRDGKVAIDLLAPLSRLGGADYGVLGEVFSLARVPFAEWERRQGRPA